MRHPNPWRLEAAGLLCYACAAGGACREDEPMLGWFDTKEVDAFAASVVDEYARLRRSVVVRHDTADKRTQKFDKLTAKVKAFVRERRLNFYKKARLLSRLRDGLSKQDVPEAEVSAFLNSLLLAPIG
jgi:hypothetical protein